MISQIIKLVSLLLFIIISPFYGCVTINDLNEMKLELSSEEVTDNIEELNNILEAKETDDPYFYWKVMDTAAYIAKISSLYKLNNNAYIRLKNNYKDIVFNEPFPDDEYDWIDKGYNVIDSKELLSTNAIKYISFIESPNSLDDLIQLLNDVNEKNPKYDIHRKIIMSLLLDNIEKISDDLYLKQKLMVSLCKTSTVINDNDIKNLVISLRKKISDLDLYISLISNYKKFFKNDNYFLRLLDFNEIYWKEIVKGNFKKYNKKLLINFNQLGILSNSNMDIILTNTGIDKLPQRTNNRNIITRTNSLLKNYIPELYYRKILIESNKDIERLLETHRIQSYIKEIRNTNYNNKIGINKNDKSFFNYNLVLNKDYNIENDLLFKKINFESLIGRVYKQNEKYQSEILSSLSKIYPIYLYQFLLNNLKKDDLDIKIINQAILYAYFLQNEFKNNDLEELKQSLITFISKKILNYESYDLNKFFNENIKLLINLYDIKLPKIFDELIQNNELNYDEQIIITKFFFSLLSYDIIN